MSHEHYLIACTCPDDSTARRLAEGLVEQNLAACVNMIPQLTSIYRWQGRVDSATEVLLLIKTTRARYSAVEAALTVGHPYDVPEIIALSIEQGLPAYLDWINQSVI
jgi:periplasmic divalent cation tolerance protein